MTRPRATLPTATLGIIFAAINAIGVDAFGPARQLLPGVPALASSSISTGVSFPSSSALGSYLDSLGASGGSSGASTPPVAASSAQGRVPILAGNWKLNPATLSDAANLCQGLAAKADASRVEVVVFPPFPYLSMAISMLEGTGIKVGAQNCALATSGAHTGEVAVSMIRSLGCSHVLLGHSERRSIYGETEADINAKVHLCLEEDPSLGVILCVGETEEEYDSGLLRSIVDVQIKKGLARVNQSDLPRIVIAYEPVWAIGTGKVATPEQAQIAHEAVRQTLADMFGVASDTVRIQYGGSVTPDSIDSLMIMPDLDGALVGGASLSADSFARIVEGGAASGL
mmetsp:Transcript_2172/g.6326  ORF Transcript_2172/g.6326 Transcript_2172/m.6326 type:complete len:342 (+) Transcript_2172:3-1028(+)